MGIKEFFRPRQNKFLQSLIQQAEITLEGMSALESYMKKRSDKYATSITQAEKGADEVRREVQNLHLPILDLRFQGPPREVEALLRSPALAAPAERIDGENALRPAPLRLE